MTDYIKRTDAVKIAEKYGLANGSVLGRHTGLADCIASEISGLPAADVAPVVHGKWIKNELLSTDFAPVYDCSECHKSIVQKYITLPPRCEHCGALMDWRCR